MHTAALIFSSIYKLLTLLEQIQHEVMINGRVATNKKRRRKKSDGDKVVKDSWLDSRRAMTCTIWTVRMHGCSAACWARLALSRPLIDWRVIELRKNLTLCLRARHRLIISLSVRIAFMQYGCLSFMKKDTFCIYPALYSVLLGKLQLILKMATIFKK